jgi:hypothetical protein
MEGQVGEQPTGRQTQLRTGATANRRRRIVEQRREAACSRLRQRLLSRGGAKAAQNRMTTGGR